jgi:hypothetical protein
MWILTRPSAWGCVAIISGYSLAVEMGMGIAALELERRYIETATINK